MALSGSLKSSTYGSMGLIFSWTATQNVTNNTSTIKWNVKSYGRESNFYYMAGAFKFTIDGSTVYSSDDRIQLFGNGATTVASGSKTITHNSDGSRTFKVTIEAGIYTYAVNVTGSTTFTLDKIDRYPTAPKVVDISAGNGDYYAIGDTVTVKATGATGVITGYESQYRYNNGSWSSSTKRSSATFTDTWGTSRLSGYTIQYRMRALNGTLASDWTLSNNLTISGEMDIKVSGSWKTGSVWIKISGTWKRAKRVWVKVNGTWKQSK